MYNKLKQIILFWADIVILFSALYLTLLARYHNRLTANIWQVHIEPFSFIFVLWILVLYISDLYNLKSAINSVAFLQKSSKSILIAGLSSVLFFYLFPQIIAPKTNLLIFIVIFSALFISWRSFFNWIIKSYVPKSNIAIIGMDYQVVELIKELKQKPHLGYTIAFVIYDGGENMDGVKSYNDINKLKELVKKHSVAEVILTESPHHSNHLRAILFECLSEKVSYRNLPDFYEKIIGKIPAEAINQTWFLENLNEGNKRTFDAIKRVRDLFIAIFLFLVTLPFWPLIALIIKLDSRGTVFYKQNRVGKYEKNFNIIKFRTMTTDAEKDGAQWASKNDTRITTFGSFLRVTRIDEIPQVINIIKGEMSFIGPRPERPEFTEKLKEKIPFYNERHLVKPGLSGWAQINYDYGSSEKDALEKLQYDLYYIKNRSVYLDLSITLKTIATVLSRAGR